MGGGKKTGKNQERRSRGGLGWEEKQRRGAGRKEALLNC
jgi:hypothetical protein